MATCHRSRPTARSGSSPVTSADTCDRGEAPHGSRTRISGHLTGDQFLRGIASPASGMPVTEATAVREGADAPLPVPRRCAPCGRGQFVLDENHCSCGQWRGGVAEVVADLARAQPPGDMICSREPALEAGAVPLARTRALYCDVRL
jgi:hypothetical protein